MAKNISERYGSMKIVWQSEKLTSFATGEIKAPLYVRFKPTNKCNHHCLFCSYDPKTGDIDVRNIMNRKDEMSRAKLLEVLDDFRDMGVKAVTYSGGGEPLMHPNIEEAIKKTLEFGINLSIITNGQLLNGNKASLLANSHWVRVSSDSSDAKSFSEIRGVPESWFYDLTENIRNFAKIKGPNCELGINYVVHKKNADQVYRSAQHFKDLGVNHIKITPMWSQDFTNYHAPIKDSVLEQIASAKQEFDDETFKVYDTYEGDFEGASVSERDYSRCWIMQTTPVVGADNNVYFCHDKAYSSTGVLGSIRDISFKELWFSKGAKKIFETFNPSQNCKHHCANDFKNRLINKAIGCYGSDINFI